MKTKPYTVLASLGLGFTIWRLWERSSLNRRFVAAGIDPGDASVATAQIIPFFATTTAADIEDTIQKAAAPGQVDAEYVEMAGDAWLIAQGKGVS